MMNLKVISRNVGSALLVSALFMFLSIIVSMLNGNDSAFAALSISFIITFIVGIFPFIFVRNTARITLTDGYMIIFLSWILSFIFGMLPYVLWGGPFTVVNALFESVSGFTTTGATILEEVESLPRSLLFWRSSTHFIGGLGVVVFLLLIIPMSPTMKLRLTNMEISSLSKDGYNTRANKTVFIFASVYLGLTLSAFLAYMLGGMSAFDAINHAFSVVATGGFSTNNLSIGGFGSNWINIITIFFMFVSAVHFGLIYMSVANRSFKPLNNPVLKFYLGTMIIGSLIVAMSLLERGDISLPRALMEGAFNVVSYASTTGFAICDNSHWPYFAGVILLWCSIQCGMAGSTTGGLKADRVLLLFNVLGRQVRQAIHPSEVRNVKLGKHIIRDDEIYPHIVYIAIYGLVILLSTILCLLAGADSEDVLTCTVTSLGNVGATVGDIGALGNFNSQPDVTKIFYSIDMLLGRLEIYPVLAIFAMLSRRRG